MAKPQFIRMLGKKIPILYVDDLLEDDGCFGDFTESPLRIRVDARLEKQELDSTILHESLHAALHLLGRNATMSEGEEEALVKGLEHALETVVRIRKR